MVRFLKSFKYEIKKSLAVFSCWWLSLTSPQSILIAYRISPSHAKFILYLWKNFVVWFHELKRQYFTEKSYHCHVGFASLNPWGIIRANKDIRSCQFESLGTLLWNEKDFSREKVYKKAICHFGLPSRRSVRMVKIRKWRMQRIGKWWKWFWYSQPQQTTLKWYWLKMLYNNKSSKWNQIKLDIMYQKLLLYILIYVVKVEFELKMY